MRARDEMGGFLESEYENSDMNEDECDKCGMIVGLKNLTQIKGGSHCCEWCADWKLEGESESKRDELTACTCGVIFSCIPGDAEHATHDETLGSWTWICECGERVTKVIYK